MYTEYLGPIDRENLTNSASSLEQAARKLQQGQIIAFPSETIYGLGGSILNAKTIQRIFEVKSRPQDLPLPIAISNIDQMKFIASEIPFECQCLAREFLPGPLTLVLKKNPRLSSKITGGNESVAIRFPSDPIAQRLIEMTGCPLVFPSANISGKLSPTKPIHVREDLYGKIDGLVDGGETEYGMESTVISLENPSQPLLLRFGVISHRRIEKVLGRHVQIHPIALYKQGSSSSHQLRSAVRLFSSWDEMKIYLKLSSSSKRLVMSGDDSPLTSTCDHFRLTTKNLYEGLRLADRDGYAEVLVHCSPAIGQNEFLLNRLKQIART
ncbi:MAG: Threonylcarbamoyl-AMP synthase [Chlamydiae bacterium]|nr:Threonylcarbamoyl-AMP synthase [Chlamydiota bacterium]